MLCLHYCFGINMPESNTYHKLHIVLILVLSYTVLESTYCRMLLYVLYLQVNILIIIINSYLICIFWFIIQLFCGSTTVCYYSCQDFYISLSNLSQTAFLFPVLQAFYNSKYSAFLIKRLNHACAVIIISLTHYYIEVNFYCRLPAYLCSIFF